MIRALLSFVWELLIAFLHSFFQTESQKIASDLQSNLEDAASDVLDHLKEDGICHESATKTKRIQLGTIFEMSPSSKFPTITISPSLQAQTASFFKTVEVPVACPQTPKNKDRLISKSSPLFTPIKEKTR
jgi:hypothetical protein